MVNLREKIIKSLLAHANGEIQIHLANVEVYLNNPAGIGEHSDITGAIQEELEEIIEEEMLEEIEEEVEILEDLEILDVVDEIFEGESIFVDQDNSKATYAKKITKNEGQIDWKSDAFKIIGKINGLYPSPGAFFNLNGQ